MTYAQAFNTQLGGTPLESGLGNNYTINNSGGFDLSQCGDVYITEDNVNVVGNVTTLYNITRPGTTTGSVPTDVTFTNVEVDLTGHASSGTMTVVSVGSNCVARGNIDVFNKPAGMTVVPVSGAGSHPSLTVTVH
jgi:hypothetical protein